MAALDTVSIVILLGAVIVLEALPVTSYLRARQSGISWTPDLLDIGAFAAAALCCIAAARIPLTMAIRRLEHLEV